MSGISDLARSFEERSKQQASDIEKSVGTAYAQHEKNLIDALESSEQKLNAAIQAREKSLSELLSVTEANTRALALSGWKWLAGTLLMVILPLSGGLWWTGQILAENFALIEQQKVTMARAQALGIQFHEDSNGQFIILPRGMKGVLGWDFDKGRRNAIKLEK